METYAVGRVVREKPRPIRVRRWFRAMKSAPEQPHPFRNADRLPGRFKTWRTPCGQAGRIKMLENAFRISELRRRNSADLPNTRNALDETASSGVNWLIHVSSMALTSRKGEPGFGIHTRTAAHQPDAHTAVHVSMP
jgi:hypothetical protein